MLSSLYNPIQADPLPTYEGDDSLVLTPFHLSFSGLTTSINKYSAILTDIISRETLTIFGLEGDYDLNYGDKLYIEVCYDHLLNPVSARVRADDRWVKLTNQTTLLDGSATNVNVYPSESDIITKVDLQPRLLGLTKDLQSASSQNSAWIAAVSAEQDDGTITADEAAAQISDLNAVLDAYLKGQASLQSSLSKMFHDASVQKHYASYKMLAYTTHNLDSNLGGSIVYPSDGSQRYQIVPTLNSDLLAVDACLTGIPCKLLVNWSRPIYQFEEDGQTEDATQTSIQ